MLGQSSRLASFSKNLIRNLPWNPTKMKRYLADKCCPTDVAAAKDSQIKNDAFSRPNFLSNTVFRAASEGEVFGPNAHKCKEYKNPEYFAYHRYTFYDLQSATTELAKCAEGGVLYEAESDTECEEDGICDYDGDANQGVTKGEKNDCSMVKNGQKMDFESCGGGKIVEESENNCEK